MLCFILFAPNAHAFETNEAGTAFFISPDKKTEIAANMRQAMHFMEKGDYVSAKRKLERVLELDKDHAEAKTLLAQCEQKIETQRAAELEDLNNAVEAGTEQALHNFIENHPESFYIEQAEKYLQDFHLWTTAQQKGTKEAYDDYLSASTVQGYKKEALLAIKTIDAEAAWEICKKKLTTYKLEKFIEEYSDTPFEKEAKYELYLIIAEDYYTKGPHATALEFYEDANKIHSLTGQYSKHYRELVTEQRYNQVKTSSSVYELKDFLSRTSTDSPYYNPISNRLALVLANNLPLYSSEEDFKEALRYARDNETRASVKRIIESVKIRQRSQRQGQRQLARKNAWKGNTSWGWNIFDCYLGNDVFEFESGVRIRFGQAYQRFNFLIGMDIQFFIYSYPDYSYSYSYTQTDMVAKLAIPASLRINLGEGYSHWYLGLGTILYPNLATNTNPCIAIEPQIGYSFGRLDFALHLRHMTNEYGIIGNSRIKNMVGYYCTYYF